MHVGVRCLLSTLPVCNVAIMPTHAASTCSARTSLNVITICCATCTAIAGLKSVIRSVFHTQKSCGGRSAIGWLVAGWPAGEAACQPIGLPANRRSTISESQAVTRFSRQETAVENRIDSPRSGHRMAPIVS